jgi:MoxR-like ATPase
MEIFLGKLGKDYLQKAHEMYAKDYSSLSIGEKYQLLAEMLLEAKWEIDPSWDTTTFHRFLYNCVKRELEVPLSEFAVEIEDDLVLGDDQPLPLPSKQQLDNAISKISNVLMVEQDVIRQIVSNLVAGKSILLAGPIGTGKTHLAKLIPEIIWNDYDGGYYSEVVAATADWTTQNVIGGIYPKVNESEEIVYTVQKGCVSDTISKNWLNGRNKTRRKYQRNGKTYRGIWLVIDEFNRANIDRAFGEMITAMEHGCLKIPTTDEKQTYEELEIPKDYRIIATLNTFDKHYLFKLSDALKRRFAYIEVIPPKRTKAEVEKYYILKRSLEDLAPIPVLSDKITLDHEKKEIIREKTDKSIISAIDALYETFSFIRLTKDLGTAVMISMCKFILVDSLLDDKIENSIDNALISNLIPQLESLQKQSIQVIRAFCCDPQATNVFKSHNPTQIGGRGYEIEFRKLLQYLGKGNIDTKVQRYVKGEIKPEEWDEYEPWTNKYRPILPNFRRSLDELLIGAEII